MRGAETNEADDARRAMTALVEAARELLTEDLSARQQAGLVRFEQAVAQRTLRSGTRARRFLLGLGLAAAGAAGAVLMFQPHDERLTFRVVNGTVSDGGYVRGKAGGGTEVRFSDGSTFALEPGTSTRVTEIDAHGSRVLLESGRARVRVAHLPAARWTVEAGSYEVQVVGTEFDVRWSGSEEILDVHVQRGKIVVRGPLAMDGLTVEAGQHLVANLKDGEIFLDTRPGLQAAAVQGGRVESPESAPADPGRPDPAQAVVPPLLSRVRPGAVRPTAPDGKWGTMIAQGDFQHVLADAEQRGLARVLETAPATELSALADAARYVRRNEVARRTLMAALDRFPHSATASEAAFFLGGLAEEEPGAGAAKSALAWYQRYLAESPRGTYAAQALGRQMLLVDKLRGGAAARSVATEYLQRFPSGPYAGPARKLLQD